MCCSSRPQDNVRSKAKTFRIDVKPNRVLPKHSLAWPSIASPPLGSRKPSRVQPESTYLSLALPSGSVVVSLENGSRSASKISVTAL